MTYEILSELLEELIEAGVNPYNDIEMCKHYVTVHGYSWSEELWEEWEELNHPDSIQVKKFQLL